MVFCEFYFGQTELEIVIVIPPKWRVYSELLGKGFHNNNNNNDDVIEAVYTTNAMNNTNSLCTIAQSNCKTRQ